MPIEISVFLWSVELFLLIAVILTLVSIAFWWRARQQGQLLQKLVDVNYDTLSSLAQNKPLAEKLSDICEFIESHLPHSYFSVMIVNHDETHLKILPIAQLPNNFLHIVRELPIAEHGGSSGAAAALGEPVFVEDMTKDHRFAEWRSSIKKHTLRSAWSLPFYSPNSEKILGTFAVYNRYVGLPSDQQLVLLERARDLISLIVAQHQDNLSRERSEQHANSLFEYNPEGVFTLDLEGHFLSLNSAGERLIEYTAKEVCGKSYESLIVEADKERARKHFKATISGHPQFYEIHITNRSGHSRTLHITNLPIIVDGVITGVHGIAKDVTQQLEYEERLNILQRSMESTTNGVMICDARKRSFPVTYVNPAFTEITGYSEEEIIGRNSKILQGKGTDLQTVRRIRNALKEQREIKTTILNYHKNGAAFWNELVITPIRDDNNEVTHFVGVQSDVTARISREKELAYRAMHDELTNLPNRLALEQHLTKLSAGPDLKLGSIHAMFIDLDGFKPVNDSFGHKLGDYVLIQTAKRLRAVLEPGDFLARFGGDEFVVIMHNRESAFAVEETAKKVMQEFHQPFSFDQIDLSLSAALGLAMNDKHVNNLAEVVQHADMAMFEVKRFGKNGYQWYTPNLEHGLQLQLERRAQLQEAIRMQQFELFYQPILTPAGAISGVEGLLRWNHPELGYISPAEFIPIAEKTGQIIAVSEWVLNQACRDLKALLNAGVPQVNVNFSPMQFYRGDFISNIEQVILDYNVQPGQLVAEITENVLMHDSELVLDLLNNLHELGIEIALDDFGTGFASLGYLNRIPVQKIKIDRSFIHNVHNTPRNAAITRGVLAMAQELNILTVAEGVEVEAECNFLLEHQCDFFQGYLFARPQPLKETLAWLKKRTSLHNK